MLKRIFILILALCCAFSFICQPVSAASTGVVLTAAMIGMAVAGAFGIYYASQSGYEAFGNNLHSSVISVPDGESWWQRASMGLIQLANLPTNLRKSIWDQAAQAADSMPQTGQDQYSYDFTLSSYSLNNDGSVSSSLDFRGCTLPCYNYFGVPIYCLEYAFVSDVTPPSIPYSGYFGIILFSSEIFYYNSSPIASHPYDISFYGYSYYSERMDDVRLRKNCMFFPSKAEFLSYMSSMISLSSGISSAGGAAAAYPAYGYDGVNLPDIDLRQPGLVAEDGTSKVSELISQLQRGAITWEDYIGTVAPGQTATITITDENGAAVTYTLTNTGVGEKVETGTEPGDETIPVVIPPGSEIVGDDAVSLLKSISTGITNFMNSVVALLQAIYDWGVQLGTDIRTFFESVIAKIQAVYEAVVEWLSAVKEAIIQLGIQIGEFIANGVQTIVTTIETWLKWVVEQLLAGLQALGQTLIDAITAIFVPSADFITAKVDALRARFNFADSIIVTGEAIRDSLNGFGSEPPIIYAELANSRGQYDWGVRAIALDLTWYSEYKPTVDGIISSFLWLMFAWKIFVKLSGIINGAGSDAQYVLQHERNLQNERNKK